MAKKFVAFNPADDAEAIAHAIVESMRNAKKKEPEKKNNGEGEKKDGGK